MGAGTQRVGAITPLVPVRRVQGGATIYRLPSRGEPERVVTMQPEPVRTAPRARQGLFLAALVFAYGAAYAGAFFLVSALA